MKPHIQPQSPKVVLQDKDMIVVDKPVGWTVYEEDTDEAVLPWLKERFGYEVYPVHRLDKETSGILLFSRERSMTQKLQQLFQAHKIRKTYHAIVVGEIHKGATITEPLSHKGETRNAITFISPLKCFRINEEPVTLLECTPKTGRFHQIRKHLSKIGHPIVGDRLYGNKILQSKFSSEKLNLRAVRLEFEHPKTKKRIALEVGSLGKSSSKKKHSSPKQRRSS